MMTYRYYLTMRPVSIGTFPGNPIKIESFDYPQYVLLRNGDDVYAYGYVEYTDKLYKDDADVYDLVADWQPCELTYVINKIICQNPDDMTIIVLIETEIDLDVYIKKYGYTDKYDIFGDEVELDAFVLRNYDSCLKGYMNYLKMVDKKYMKVQY